jgi:hypothetical protein
MQATRIIKTIEHTDLRELASYLGQTVEIIISPVSDQNTPSSENERGANREKFFEIIEQCTASVKPWTREELYER